MSNNQAQTFIIEDGDEELEIGVYSQNIINFEPDEVSTRYGDDDNNELESMSPTISSNAIKTSMQEVHKYIRFYTKYAIGAFKNFGEGEIEEINLKFGLKIGGKTGLPMVAEGSTEADFQIEVKCKFPTNKP